MLREYSNECRAQSAELVLLDELVKVHAEQLKHQTQMLPVNEGIFQAQNVVVIVLVVLAVELRRNSQSRLKSAENLKTAYQVQNRDFHHTLVEVRCFILDNFDGNHFLGSQVLALHNLAKGSLTQNVQNEISVPEMSATPDFVYAG